MAGRAGACAAAQTFDVETMLTDDFHHAPSFDRFDLMLPAPEIPDANDAHACNSGTFVLPSERRTISPFHAILLDSQWPRQKMDESDLQPFVIPNTSSN
jgi:hypothetical protein